jgi:hypothetical protein
MTRSERVRVANGRDRTDEVKLMTAMLRVRYVGGGWASCLTGCHLNPSSGCSQRGYALGQRDVCDR